MNPIDTAIAHYRTVDGYQATIRATRGHNGETIHYSYQRPGLVRMEFITPHQGALLIYKPSDRRVYLWPFGTTKLPPLKLDPDNPLIRSPTGQKVDRSDVGALLDNAHLLQQAGRTEIVGKETIENRIGLHVEITGNPDVRVGEVHRYDLWFDEKTYFPIKIVSYRIDNAPIETVVMGEVQLNPVFPKRFFSP